MAAEPQYLDLRNVLHFTNNRGAPTWSVVAPWPTLGVEDQRTWPRSVGWQQYAPLVAGGVQYGGGAVHGPLDPALIPTITAALVATGLTADQIIPESWVANSAIQVSG